MKSYLFVLRKPTICGAYSQEMLDIILTAAVFDQHVAILLLDGGVFQLKKNQHPNADIKDTSCIFRALEIYDVKKIYVEYESIQERGLESSDLFLPVQICYRKNLTQLFLEFDVLFSN